MVPAWAFSSPPMPAAPAPPVAESEPRGSDVEASLSAARISVAPPGTVTPARPTPPVAAFSPTSASVAVTPEAIRIAPPFVTAEASTTALESVTAQPDSTDTVPLDSDPDSTNGPAPASVTARVGAS